MRRVIHEGAFGGADAPIRTLADLSIGVTLPFSLIAGTLDWVAPIEIARGDEVAGGIEVIMEFTNLTAATAIFRVTCYAISRVDRFQAVAKAAEVAGSGAVPTYMLQEYVRGKRARAATTADEVNRTLASSGDEEHLSVFGMVGGAGSMISTIPGGGAIIRVQRASGTATGGTLDSIKYRVIGA
jgi:hypothetical protein